MHKKSGCQNPLDDFFKLLINEMMKYENGKRQVNQAGSGTFALNDEKQTEIERVCPRVGEYVCYEAHSLSYPDPFQVHCNVSLIYVTPHLHLSKMSTL